MGFPESLDVFVDKDGNDDIASSDPNVAYDAIENIEGFLGAIGKPQSWSATLISLLAHYRAGMQVEAVDGTLYVRLGEAILQNTDATKWNLRQNTADVTLSASNLDVGSLAATQYYVYAKAPAASTTAPIVFSTDANAPSAIGTIPYVKLGWFTNAAAGALTPTNAGNYKKFYDGANYAEVRGVSNTSTNNTSLEDMADMSLTFLSSGRPVEIIFSCDLSVQTGQKWVGFAILVDGTVVETQYDTAGGSSPVHVYVSGVAKNLAEGSHIAKVQWKSEDVTIQYQLAGTFGPRRLRIKEL